VAFFTLPRGWEDLDVDGDDSRAPLATVARISCFPMMRDIASREGVDTRHVSRMASFAVL